SRCNRLLSLFTLSDRLATGFLKVNVQKDNIVMVVVSYFIANFFTIALIEELIYRVFLLQVRRGRGLTISSGLFFSRCVTVSLHLSVRRLQVDVFLATRNHINVSMSERKDTSMGDDALSLTTGPPRSPPHSPRLFPAVP